MNILHVVQRYWPYQGGSERYMQDLGEQLAAEGHQVTVWTTDADDLELFWDRSRPRLAEREAAVNGVRVQRFPVRHLPWHQLMAGVLGRLPSKLLDLQFRPPAPLVPSLLMPLGQRFDVVHATSLPYNSLLLAAYRVARRQNARLIFTPHLHTGEPGDDKIVRHYARPSQVWLLAQADAVVARTESEARFLAACGVPRTKLHVVGGWVRPDQLQGGDPGRFRRRHSLGEEPLVVYLGMRAYDKGTHHLVEAMKRLWTRGCQARLAMAGPSFRDFREFFEAQPADVQARAIVLDYLPESDKLDLLAAGSIFVMPSRVESFGIVFLEAWLNGLPVIGARAGGAVDVIDDRHDGYLVPFGAADELAARIEALLRDRALAARMAEAGRQKTLARFTLEKLYARIRALYDPAGR